LEHLDASFQGVVRPRRIIVHSSASTDGTDEIVQAFAERSSMPVVLLKEETCRGKCAAVNALMAALADVEVIVLMSADVLPGERCIERLLATFTDPSVGVAGGRPVPEGPRGNPAVEVSRLLWKLHHEIALECPKTTEISAFRNIGLFLDERSLVDEAELECAFTSRGYRVVYEPEAVIRTNAPTTLGDYVRQRTRVTNGHLRLSREKGYTLGTLSMAKRWRALARAQRAGECAWFTALGAVLLETFIYAAAFAASLIPRRKSGVWGRINSAKRPLSPGRDNLREPSPP
jgi:biofilm PGA synthesis N-glycosyltransferase PgaC